MKYPKVRSCRLPAALDERVAALIAQGFNFGLIVSELLRLSLDAVTETLPQRRDEVAALHKQIAQLEQQARVQARGICA